MLEKLHESFKCDPVHLAGELFDEMWMLIQKVERMEPTWATGRDAWMLLEILESSNTIPPGFSGLPLDYDDYLDLPRVYFEEMVDIIKEVALGDFVSRPGGTWRLVKRADELLSEQTLIAGRRRSFSDPEPIPAIEMSIAPDENPSAK